SFFFFSSRRRHTRWPRDWSSDVCSSDLIQQSGVGADWAGVLTDELHAVVIGRVVARRHRDAAVEFFRKRSEVRALRAPQADVESIHTGIDQAALECRGELRAREPDVVPDGDLPGLYKGGIGATDVIGQRIVDLIGDPAADIVGLERIEIGHGFRW